MGVFAFWRIRFSFFPRRPRRVKSLSVVYNVGSLVPGAVMAPTALSGARKEVCQVLVTIVTYSLAFGGSLVMKNVYEV